MACKIHCLLASRLSSASLPATTGHTRLQKLDAALEQLAQLTATIESLRSDLARLKKPEERSSAAPATAKGEPFAPSEKQASTSNAEAAAYRSRVLGIGLGASERDETLTARPELFFQGRYSAASISGSDEAFRPNFRLSRIESRWSGRVASRLGVGLEIQYHPAPDGSPEELVNDAFIEYYANDYVSLRAGQFIKPFGFDIQQSSSLRESPARGILAGYFFPGQRDRGLMLFGNLGFLGGDTLKRTQYFVAAVNGNRFFNDSNRQANYLLRIRHVNARNGIALGALRPA
ncbi:MAG: OprO/OprP family phosphate-selective porin [Acidobacteria bacterium]|nr:OprO/OprP family phosphate-selective porin [Acidobacteriota bacterium]